MRLLAIQTVLCLSILLLSGCAAEGDKMRKNMEQAQRITLGEEPPLPPREFRAVWVATVGNIDWPSKPGLSSADQQAEALAILDRCKELNFNAVILQVRPACDAFYASRYEPWSYYLTGEQGKPPSPFYDPLQFWIDQAHARGIELHAWFNPYRARAGAARYESAASHVSKAKPQIVREFNHWQWLDPAEPEAQKQTYNVFLDVVKRYNVDGIHIDDYFYPYPDYLTVDKKTEDFPDEAAWQRYVKASPTTRMSRDDWRRSHVDALIHKIYDGIKRTRRPVKFGISPFGLGKPSLRPEGITGFSQYDKLYADADQWFEKGWCDYWTPQLYWKIDKKGQEFPTLVDYWISQNKQHRHFWPGMFTGRVGDGEQNWPVDEVINQIEITREHGGKSDGQVHFSMKVFMRDRGGINEALKKVYATPALVPASTWLDDRAPAKPQVGLQIVGSDARLDLRPAWGERPALWCVWTRFGDVWEFEIHPASTTTLTMPAHRDGAALSRVAVSAVDRCGNESERAIVLAKW